MFAYQEVHCEMCVVFRNGRGDVLPGPGLERPQLLPLCSRRGHTSRMRSIRKGPCEDTGAGLSLQVTGLT